MIEVGRVVVEGIDYGILKDDLIVFQHPGLLSQLASDGRVSVFQQKKRLSRVFYFKLSDDEELRSLFEKWSRLQTKSG